MKDCAGTFFSPPGPVVSHVVHTTTHVYSEQSRPALDEPLLVFQLAAEIDLHQAVQHEQVAAKHPLESMISCMASSGS